MALTVVTDPIEQLDALDQAMRYSAHDPERFKDICATRERVHARCEEIAEAVAAFLRGAFS